MLGIKDKDRDEAVDRLTRVFGIHSISPAIAVEKEWNAIADSAMELMRRALGESRSATFKVMARRADKRFPMNSEEINRELGHVLLESFPGLSVDVHSPKIKMCVEIREKAYLYCEEIPGANGYFPVLVNPKLSGTGADDGYCGDYEATNTMRALYSTRSDGVEGGCYSISLSLIHI
mgnify:FL=1